VHKLYLVYIKKESQMHDVKHNDVVVQETINTHGYHNTERGISSYTGYSHPLGDQLTPSRFSLGANSYPATLINHIQTV